MQRQWEPLKYNEARDEVYLQLPHPYENIILTPPHESDAAAVVEILNDFQVVKTLEGPPYPYDKDDADWWLSRKTKECKEILDSLRDAPDPDSESAEAPLPFAGGCPVRTIREVQADGSELFLGDIGIERCLRFDFLRNRREETKAIDENLARQVGDPEIIWDIGDYIRRSHHGKGIMTTALRVLINDWAIPRMNVRKIIGITFEDNIGSTRVFEKNGFKLFDTVHNCVHIPESKGGGTTGLNFLEWKLPSTTDCRSP